MKDVTISKSQSPTYVIASYTLSDAWIHICESRTPYFFYIYETENKYNSKGESKPHTCFNNHSACSKADVFTKGIVTFPIF